MAINLSKYVDITSGLGAGAVATTRSLVGRLFTPNSLVAPATYLTFSTASSVGAYFGTSSEEYDRALFYFSFISKSTTTPQSIQFARYTSSATAPGIFFVGGSNASVLSNWTSITGGSFGLTINGVAKTFSSLDFSGASDLAGVATIVQNAIRNSVIVTKSATTTSSDDSVTMSSTASLTAGMIVTGTGIPSNTTVVSVDSGTAITISNNATASATNTLTFYTVANAVWALATVSYVSSNQSFTFTGGAAGAMDISVQAGASPGVDITGLTLLGWIPQCVNVDGVLVPSIGSIWAYGSDGETTAECLASSAELSNNFGSFLFLNSASLSNDDIVTAATWNQAENVMFLYTVGVATSNVSALQTLLSDIGGVALTLSPLSTEYPEQIPMMIEASTDYTATNAVQNYMYQQATAITPSVTTDDQSDAYDVIRVNYYGSTQTAGQIISFYQRGLLQGVSVATNIGDMTAYVNEIWLKDAAGVAILNLLLGLNQIAANSQGRSQILSALQEVINQALDNGTISVGKTLTSSQQAYITNVTADDKAWYQVQNSGYWIDCQIVPSTLNPGEYEADYLLIYSKDDVIRKVVGTQTLI